MRQLNSDVQQRFLQFFFHIRLPIKDFSEKLQVSEKEVFKILSGLSDPNELFLLKLIANFEGLSARWLLNGEGNMFDNQEDKASGMRIGYNSGKIYNIIGSKIGSLSENQPKASES